MIPTTSAAVSGHDNGGASEPSKADMLSMIDICASTDNENIRLGAGISLAVAVEALFASRTPAAAVSMAVPSGWVLVPVDLTEAMMHAAEDVPSPRQYGAVYRAMLAAAPAAPVSADVRDGALSIKTWRERCIEAGDAPIDGHMCTAYVKARDAEIADLRAALASQPAPVTQPSPYWQSQRKMIERAIIGLRDGWATRKDAEDALAVLSAAPVTQQAAPNLKHGFAYHESLDIKAVSYMDVINDRQVCRDDLWLATTEALNALRMPVPAVEAAPQPSAALLSDAWISVDERLPEAPGHYLLVLRAGSHGMAPNRAVEGQYRQLHAVWTVRDVGVAVSVTDHVTHWMPLPAAPAILAKAAP